MTEHDEAQAAELEQPAAEPVEELEHQEPEQPAAEPEAPTEQPAGLAYNDRTLVLGFTGSGKSTLLNHLWSRFRTQRLIVDTKGHEFDVGGPAGEPVMPVRDVDSIDWQQPVIHYVDRTGTIREYDELFEACFARRQLVVRVDELADLCEYRPNAAPLGFRKYTAKGRAHGLGLLAASQRPHLIPTAARTEAQHVFIFGPRLDGDDHAAISKTLGKSDRELGDLIDALPPYGFLWWHKAARRLVHCAPLPAHLRATAAVRSRTVA